jgi:hypothetical protein
LPNVSLQHLRNTFGKWIVGIEDPRRFVGEVCRYLEARPALHVLAVEGCYVRYDKGHKRKTPLSNLALSRLAYVQKPLCFRSDREFRVVVVIGGPPASRFNECYLHIDLGHRLDYATCAE